MPSEIEVFRAAMKIADPETVEKLRNLALTGRIKSYDSADATKPLIVVATTDHCGISGCRQARCACGTLVWLSPSTQAMLKERDRTPTAETRIVCGECFIVELESRREEKRTH